MKKKLPESAFNPQWKTLNRAQIKYRLFFLLLLMVVASNSKAQDYKANAMAAGANFEQIVSTERARLAAKKLQLQAAGKGEEKSEEFREENAQFERWVLLNKNLVKSDGSLFNPLTGWANYFQTPSSPNGSSGINGAPVIWTGLGPTGAATVDGGE